MVESDKLSTKYWGSQGNLEPRPNERAQAHLFSQFKIPSKPFLVSWPYVFIFATNL